MEINIDKDYNLYLKTSNENINRLKKLNNVILIFVIILFTIGLYFIYFGLENFGKNGDKLKLNELGDFYTGSVGICWGLVGVLLIFIAFLAQKEQNIHQALELKMNQYLFDKQIEQSNLRTKMDVHLKFQAEMRKIQSQLKSTVNSKNYKPKEDEIRAIQIYWYFVFDEWFTCKNGEDNLCSLWDDHYRHGAKSALRNEKFSMVLDEILSRKTSFLGKAREFENELNELKREIRNGYP